MWRRLSTAASVGLVLACSACAPSKVYLSNNYHTAGRIAVLPMSNETNDLDGPVYVRHLMSEGLHVRGFVLLPENDIDAKLKDHGFTDGGQLGATTPQAIGTWLGADTLLYSTLESFDYINVGFYWQRRVKITARLVDAVTGEKWWETERTYSTRFVVTSKKEAEAQFAIQMAAKLLEKALHTPLQPESRAVVNLLLNTLPYR